MRTINNFNNPGIDVSMGYIQDIIDDRTERYPILRNKLILKLLDGGTKNITLSSIEEIEYMFVSSIRLSSRGTIVVGRRCMISAVKKYEDFNIGDYVGVVSYDPSNNTFTKKITQIGRITELVDDPSNTMNKYLGIEVDQNNTINIPTYSRTHIPTKYITNIYKIENVGGAKKSAKKTMKKILDYDVCEFDESKQAVLKHGRVRFMMDWGYFEVLPTGNGIRIIKNFDSQTNGMIITPKATNCVEIA
jgi:hypothetical protein